MIIFHQIFVVHSTVLLDLFFPVKYLDMFILVSRYLPPRKIAYRLELQLGLGGNCARTIYFSSHVLCKKMDSIVHCNKSNSHCD